MKTTATILAAVWAAAAVAANPPLGHPDFYPSPARPIGWRGDRYNGLITWSFATPGTDGERIYVTTGNNAVAAVDLDGSYDTKGPSLRQGGNSSPILVGDRILRFGGVSLYPKGGSVPLREVNGVGSCSMAPLEGGKETRVARALIDRRPLEDKEFGLRTLHADMSYSMHTASPAAQANRLFARTKGYLWCIGDPNEKFPVPANCPPQGRVAK